LKKSNATASSNDGEFDTSTTTAAPASESVYYSFTNWTGIGGARFIGLANFRSKFTSQIRARQRR